jgi:hypothetical protein
VARPLSRARNVFGSLPVPCTPDVGDRMLPTDSTNFYPPAGGLFVAPATC